MADHGTGPVKVTVSDPKTGKIFEEKIVSNDYVIICNGRRYLRSVQVMGKTHMLAVAWDKADPSPQPNVVPPETEERLRNALRNCLSIMKLCRRICAEDELVRAHLNDAMQVAENALAPAPQPKPEASE